VLAALCGIEREVSASLEPGVDHHVAHTRLQWWREELGRCAAGNPVHPLTRELQAHLQRCAAGVSGQPTLAGLTGLVDAAAWDLAGASFERREELTAYCRRWAAAMVMPLTPAAGSRGSGSGEDVAAADWTGFGAALRELELLGRLAADARSGRLRVPLDELERAAVAPQSVAVPPWPQGLMDILRGRHRALRGQLALAIDGLSPDAQRSCRGLLVWAALAWQASLRAEHALPLPPADSVASAVAANWRAWRAARAARTGRFGLR
jgi:phytoene synthase